MGQSGQIATRLPAHTAKGFSDKALNNSARIEIIGSKTTREIAEQRVLTGLGGKNAAGILNKVNPIGGRPGLGLSGSIDEFATNVAVPGVSNAIFGGVGVATGVGNNK